MPTLAPLLAALLAVGPGDVAWIEGESAADPHPALKSAGWGRDVLSGKKWLFAAVDANDIAKTVPEGGLTAKYPFTLGPAGAKRVYARVGYESARSPFRWRVDGGEWKTVAPDVFTTDLMAVADFAEVAWLDLGAVDLAAGAHTLEVNVPRPQKGRLLFGLDCVCVHAGDFRPDGRNRPGERKPTAADDAAARAVFDLPAAAGGGRSVATLAGAWRAARFDETGDIVDRTGPVAELPPDLDALPWRAVNVPGDFAKEVPEWEYCHRFLLRCRVNVPFAAKGRSVVLRFPNNALLSTVFVNGKRAGFSDTPCAAFECDVTPHVKPGQVNDVVVAIKDLYYAVAKTGDGKSARHLFNYPPERFHNAGGLGPTRFADFPTLYKVRRSGVLEAPAAELRGRAYSADVFAKPSVSNKSLAVEARVVNPGPAAVAAEVRHAVRPAGGGPVALVLAGEAVTVPPGGSAVVAAGAKWDSPALWWPDSPTMYEVVTEVWLDGVVSDSNTTEFGFREWGIRGRGFTLNGVPWHGRADLRHSGRQASEADAVAAVAEWRRNGQNMVRFWGDEPWVGAAQRDTLRFFDRKGVAVRRSGTFDGEVASYALVQDGKVNAALFANWRKQLAAWVKAERNHPSVFVWSLENEVTYINARNFGWLKQVEPEMKAAAALVQRLDPTRPVMVDGGDALLDQSLPVAGNHYLEKTKRDYPDEAYTLARGYAQHEQKGAFDPWPIPRDKPLFLGESFFANGSPPAAYAEVIGESAFLGRRDAAAGVARFARQLSEGYRWHGVAAFHFWFAEGADAEHYKAWQPVAVLCREHDTALPAGGKVARTLKAFNDTRSPANLTVHWLLQTRNTPSVATVRGKRDVKLAAGGADEFGITLDVPAAAPGETVDADLVLTVVRDGKEVFRDAKACRVFGAPVPVAGPTPGSVGLFDPANKAAELLRGIVDATPVRSVSEVPAGVRVLVVGPDAATPILATDPVWTALALRGVRVVVLDQAHPLHYQAVPADLEPTAFGGRTAFPEDASHPALAGLTAADLFCWPGASSVVYRSAYRKPTRGGRSLVQCDTELGLTALVEVPVGDGLLVLSQLAVGDHPTGPAARRLAANLVRRAWEYRRQARPTAVLFPESDPRRALLAAAGLTFSGTPPLADALGSAEVVVADATPETLAALVANRGGLDAFTAKGGQLVLWGLTPAGLADFNRLVGFEHSIRPFRLERVTLGTPRDPLAAGLSLRDVALESAEKIYPWAGDRYPASDTFTHVVDLRDPAPFVQSEKLADGWAKMTNGLTSADSWKFIFYHEQGTQGERPKWAGRLAKSEELTGLSVVINADYRKLTQLRVLFDDDLRTALVLNLKPERELRQEFTFPPRRCRTVTLEPLAWTPHDKPVIGIDNLWLTAARPADFDTRVRPLTNVGGLVRYPSLNLDGTPTGGGVVLCQLSVPAREANPENAAKKQAVVATVLKNLGAAFAAEKLVVPGATLATAPVPLGDKCNVFLSGDKWPGGAPGLAGLPVGEQVFAGVRYAVRDFRTSPLPAAIGVKAGERVDGVPVGRTADALFFLATAVPGPDAKKPPAAVVTVRYADGQSAEIPLTFNKTVGPWKAADPKPLPGAAVAWADGKAAAYQAQWTSPRPGVEIRALDVAGAAGSGGAVVLLAVSAGAGR